METYEHPYWHVWVDETGLTRQTERTIVASVTRHKWHGIAEILASPVWQNVRSQQVIVLQPGVEYDWHENPLPQWAICLKGRWFVETLDGTRVEMGPGELSLGEDQGSRGPDGRQGHRSGAVGDLPCVLLLVQQPGEKGSGR
ncbi:MAG: cupin domain-containing protein [Planctomycetota bacterium]|nr:cupin domain-containing protein [Planctomycetota bacterium]